MSNSDNRRFDKIDDQLERISSALVSGFDRIDKALEKKADKEDLQQIIGMIDALSKRLEISDDERLVMAHQLTRIHDWIEKAAKRIDLEFKHS